jgi:hypothetical protein
MTYRRISILLEVESFLLSTKSDHCIFKTEHVSFESLEEKAK